MSLIFFIEFLIIVAAILIGIFSYVFFSTHRSVTKDYYTDNVPLISYKDFKRKFTSLNWEIMEGFYPSIESGHYTQNKIHASLYMLDGVYYTFSFVDYFRVKWLVLNKAKSLLPHKPTKIVKVVKVKLD